MSGRVNFLGTLADMAKHNNPKQTETPTPDGTKSASGSFSFIVPKLIGSFYCSEVLEKYSTNYLFNNEIIFKQNTTPPPKIV